MLAGLSANAQGLKVAYAMNLGDEFTEITDGQTITVNEIEEEDPGYMFSIPCYLSFTNTTSSAMPLTVSAVNDPANSYLTWGIGKMCVWACYSLPSSEDGTLAAGATLKGPGTHIYYDYYSDTDEIDVDDPANWGKWAAKVTAKGGDETVTFTVIFQVGETDGIEGIEADTTDAPATYYNLQGIPVANPTAGNIYIMRQGDKTSKVLL